MCKQAEKNRDKLKDCSKMIQALSDMSLTGQMPIGGENNWMCNYLQEAKCNPVVKERRANLKKEKKRKESDPPVAIPGKIAYDDDDDDSVDRDDEIKTS